MGFFKWAQGCLSGTFGWSSPTPANFQRSRGTPAPCRTGAAWLLSPTFGAFMSPPLPSGRSGAFASSSADSQAGAESSWTNSFKPAHPPSASCEPQWGLGWFHGAAVRCPSPSWVEGQEREMGPWEHHTVLSAFRPAGKPPGKLRREQGTSTSRQEASGWVLVMEDSRGSRRAGRRQRGEEQEWREPCQNWVRRITLLQLPGPEGRSTPQRSHSTFLPSISSACPATQDPARSPAESGSLPAAACLPRRPSPPLTQLETHWGGSLVLKTERRVLMRHCSVGNCFLSFPHSW